MVSQLRVRHTLQSILAASALLIFSSCNKKINALIAQAGSENISGKVTTGGNGVSLKECDSLRSAGLQKKNETVGLFTADGTEIEQAALDNAGSFKFENALPDDVTIGRDRLVLRIKDCSNQTLERIVTNQSGQDLSPETTLLAKIVRGLETTLPLQEFQVRALTEKFLKEGSPGVLDESKGKHSNFRKELDAIIGSKVTEVLELPPLLSEVSVPQLV
ncbi:MAG: hypothetical protein IOD12_13150 [Silvanigrellales bacterium]|nr:hypothetical protein [Silvanigrellales bacterium]